MGGKKGSSAAWKAAEKAEAEAEAEAEALSQLLRDVVGHPFRPVTVEPRWLTSNVVGLARTIYDDRAHDHLPVLADALMDAGCDVEELLQHCRSEGLHARGCWAVDLLLEKEERGPEVVLFLAGDTLHASDQVPLWAAPPGASSRPSSASELAPSRASPNSSSRAAGTSSRR